MEDIEIFKGNLMNENIQNTPIGRVIQLRTTNGLNYDEIYIEKLVKYIPDYDGYGGKLPRKFKSSIKKPDFNDLRNFDIMPPIIIEPEDVLNNLEGAELIKQGGNKFYVINHDYHNCSYVKNCTGNKNYKGVTSMKYKKSYENFLYKMPVQITCWNDYKQYKFKKIEPLLKGELDYKKRLIKPNDFGSVFLLNEYEKGEENNVIKQLSNYLYEQATIINYFSEQRVK